MKGLLNDAPALILFHFGVAAIATGTFSAANAARDFFAIVMSEPTYGVAAGWAAMLRLRRWVRDPVEITLSLLTPYAAF